MANNCFSNTICPQTLSQLMFNKFKQDCSDVKATTSRKVRLTVHFDDPEVTEQPLNWCRGRDDCVVSQKHVHYHGVQLK